MSKVQMLEQRLRWLEVVLRPVYGLHQRLLRDLATAVKEEARP